MIDLKSYLPEGTRVTATDDYLLVSRSGMRKLKVKRFLHEEDLPIFFFGLGLFAGEGRQRFTKTTERIEFINSNPSYVKLFQKFLETLNLENLVMARIQLKSNIDYGSALDFWSKILGIPRERFSRPLIFQKKPKIESKMRIALFGSLVIRINRALAFKLIKYWIQTFLVNKVMGPPGLEPGTNRL